MPIKTIELNWMLIEKITYSTLLWGGKEISLKNCMGGWTLQGLGKILMNPPTSTHKLKESWRRMCWSWAEENMLSGWSQSQYCTVHHSLGMDGLREALKGKGSLLPPLSGLCKSLHWSGLISKRYSLPFLMDPPQSSLHIKRPQWSSQKISSIIKYSISTHNQ